MVSKKSKSRKVVSSKTTKKRPLMKKKTSRKMSKKGSVMKKKSSRKKSKKRPVMKKRSTRKSSKKVIMKGGDIVLICGQTEFNISNGHNIIFNSLLRTSPNIRIETMLTDFANSKMPVILDSIGTGAFNITCDLGKYTGKEQKISKYKDYVMKFVKSEIDEDIPDEIYGREIHMKISNLFLMKDGNNFSIVPDILLYSNSTEFPVYSIEEKGSRDLLDYCITDKKYIELYNILEMIEAVYFLHNNNIVHSDIKPDNFIVLGTGTGSNITIKIIDFGTAVELFKPLDSKILLACGTPGYAPLEQILTCFLDTFDGSDFTFEQFKKRDVYSLAVSIDRIFSSIKVKYWKKKKYKEMKDFIHDIPYPPKKDLLARIFGISKYSLEKNSVSDLHKVSISYNKEDRHREYFVANINARPTIEQFFTDMKVSYNSIMKEDYVEAKQFPRCVQMTTSGPCEKKSMEGRTRCRDHTCPFPECNKGKSSKVESCEEHRCTEPGCSNVISGEGK
jgi:serine/threonine protein kinase